MIGQNIEILGIIFSTLSALGASLFIVVESGALLFLDLQKTPLLSL